MPARCAALRSALAPPVLLLALLLLLPSGPAAALELLAIDFDFSADSTLVLLGGTVVTPPDGSIALASAQLQVEVDGMGIVPGGAVILRDVEFAGTVVANVAGAADISGSVSGSQMGSAAGVLSGALDQATFGEDLALDFAADIACAGAGCGSLGLPAAESGPVGLTIGVLDLIDLGILGAAGIQASIPIEIAGVLGTLELVGSEVSRSTVAEPSVAGLLALGALSGLLLATRARPKA